MLNSYRSHCEWEGLNKTRQAQGSRNSLRVKLKLCLPLTLKSLIIICSNCLRLNIIYMCMYNI